ncbi:MAG: hypothetical protein BV457_05695 [Thermoplasmata archaeon M9B1D]|nr:MAG: hypothetical protein BV457_05695 [Thermoplasmata archaeon M9B1D]
MQRLKLKRLKKVGDMPKRNTVNCFYFDLNNQNFSFSIELDEKVYITNNSNGKIYQLINEIEG